jgi:mannose-6-phosphate isomerase-like protein (cupin superfamily)
VLEGLAWEADSFISKPYNREYLIAHVAQMVANRSRSCRKSARFEVEIPYAGKLRLLSVDPQRLVTLLISSYEAAVSRNTELVKIQGDLMAFNRSLDDMVEQRTAALSAQVAECRRAEETMAAALKKKEVLLPIRNDRDSPSDRGEEKAEMIKVVNIDQCFGLFQEAFSPKIVAELNGQQVKLVRAEGDKVPWHAHEAEDELFLVLEGVLEVHERSGKASLHPGEFCVVRRGSEHKVVPLGKVKLLLFEPAGIAHTGRVRSEITKDRCDRLDVEARD